MKLAVIGAFSSGRYTLFEALVGLESSLRRDGRIGMVKVPDWRLDKLSAVYQPQKTTAATIEFYLPQIPNTEGARQKDDTWTQVRPCDAFVHVVRCFDLPGCPAQPYADYLRLEEDLIVTDLLSCEKRLDRIIQDKKRGKKINEEEVTVLESCRSLLETEKALRTEANLAGHELLKSFSFLSAKPVLLVLNFAEEKFSIPTEFKEIPNLALQAKLEQEIAVMSAEDAAMFLQEFGLEEPVRSRLIREAYQLLGLISFFTVGKDEVKAWTIKQNCPAFSAAGEIHSDIQRGFIKAETVAYQDFSQVDFSLPEARKNALLRLEGKQYIVQDGDIINFKFNV